MSKMKMKMKLKTKKRDMDLDSFIKDHERKLGLKSGETSETKVKTKKSNEEK